MLSYPNLGSQGKWSSLLFGRGLKNPLKRYLLAAAAGPVTTIEHYQDSLLQSFIRYNFEVSVWFTRSQNTYKRSLDLIWYSILGSWKFCQQLICWSPNRRLSTLIIRALLMCYCNLATCLPYNHQSFSGDPFGGEPHQFLRCYCWWF